MKHFTLNDYYKKRYFPLEEELLLGINRYCIEQQAELQAGFWRCLHQTIQDIADNIKTPVSRLYCTLQYTDFLSGNASICLYFCDEQGNALVCGRWECPWLMTFWQDFEKKVIDERDYVRSNLHPSMFRPFYPGTIRQLMEVLGEYFKVWMPLRMEELLMGVLHTAEFYVTMGEYLGEQKLIWRLRPQVNLLAYSGQHNLPEDELTYRSFQGKRYRVQTLGALNLQNCRFDDCLFEPWKFAQTDLRNVLFRNCRFHLTDFTQVNLQGAVFSDCSFTECRFDGAGGAGMQGLYPLFFEMCSFVKVTFTDCDWPGVEAWDCTFQQIRTVNCRFDDELWAEMK